jgi:hypothetical protein
VQTTERCLFTATDNRGARVERGLAQLLPRFTAEETSKRVQKAVGSSEQSRMLPGTAAGDWRKLRGLPVIARGISGEVMGSRPDRAVLRLDR